MKMYVIALMVIISGVANAQARKYSNCAVERNIVQPSNSVGFFMDNDCKKAYVLPPKVGKIRIDNYVQSLSDIQCKAEMANINVINKQMVRLDSAQSELNRAYRNIEKKYAYLLKLKKRCDPLVERDHKFSDAVARYNGEIENRELHIVNLENQFVECKANVEDVTECDDPATEIYEIKQLIVELKNNKRELEVENSKNKVELNSCKSQVEREVARIEENDNDYQAESNKLMEARNQYLEMLDKEMRPLLNEAGGHITIGYFSGHNDLVKEFQEANKNLKEISFSPMPIRNAIINFRRVANGVRAGMPVILQSTIFGLAAPSASGEVSPEQLLSAATEEVSNLFGEAVAGDMIINKYSACSLAEEFNGLRDEDRTTKFSAMIKPTVIFNYEVQADRSVGIKYNESHLYQLIKKSSSKRGFFRSKSSLSITERTESEKWIQIDIKSQDSRVTYQDREKMMMDLRREYLDRALMRVAKAYVTEEQLQLQDPGPDGATLAAAELQKVPNTYAQFAAVALNIGSALFGGSNSEASMTRTVSTQAEETLTNSEMVSEYSNQTLEAQAQ